MSQGPSQVQDVAFSQPEALEPEPKGVAAGGIGHRSKMLLAPDSRHPTGGLEAQLIWLITKLCIRDFR